MERCYASRASLITSYILTPFTAAEALSATPEPPQRRPSTGPALRAVAYVFFSSDQSPLVLPVLLLPKHGLCLRRPQPLLLLHGR
eukprot:scaffold13993_cov103-Isochrysis_galbana.AAC.1